MNKVKVKGPLIIAMMGQPCTGKTTLAERLAKKLKYGVIAEDDVRYCIAEKELEKPMLFTSSTSPDDCLNDLSFGLICQIASMELDFGSKLIIDCSLQTQAHFDRLIQMSKDRNARLVIVECKPRDRYQWRQWFKEQCECETQGTSYRYKPPAGEDLDSWFERHIGCPGEDIIDIEGISKLEVNTTDYVKDRSLADAVMYLTTYQGVLCMDFHEYGWVDNTPIKIQSNIRTEEDEDEGAEESKEDPIRGHDHVLVLFPDDSGDENDGGDHDNDVGKSTCGGCQDIIYEDVYYKCGICELSVHKLCAELPNKMELVPQKYPTLVLDFYLKCRSLQQTHKCKGCKVENDDETNKDDDRSNEDEDDDENECRRLSIYETNLRNAILPCVLVLNCHEHHLNLILDPSDNYGYDCNACGEYGQYASYACLHCGGVTFQWHLECALLPKTYKHNAHRHPLKLTFEINDLDDKSNEFYCDDCEHLRNPNHWVYSCAECTSFTCHLKCVTQTYPKKMHEQEL